MYGGSINISISRPCMVVLSIFPSQGLAWLFYQYFHLRALYGGSFNTLCNRSTFFCFQCEFSRARPCWFTLYKWTEAKHWLLVKHTPLPHLPALFVMTQTARLKEAEHSWLCFYRFQTLFPTNWTINQLKNCCVCFIPSLLIAPMILLDSQSPLTPFCRALPQPCLCTSLRLLWGSCRRLIPWIQKAITCLVKHTKFSTLGNK